MSKRALSSVTRRFFLKAGSVGGAIGAVATTGLGAFLEACSGGSFTGGSCSYGYGAGLGYGGGYGYGCTQPTSGPDGYGSGGYGTGGYGSGGYGYGSGGYGYGTGYGSGGYGYGGYGTGGYGYGGYGYGGYGYGYGAYGYGYGYGQADATPADEQDTALRLGLAPGRVGPAQRIRV